MHIDQVIEKASARIAEARDQHANHARYIAINSAHVGYALRDEIKKQYIAVGLLWSVVPDETRQGEGTYRIVATAVNSIVVDSSDLYMSHIRDRVAILVNALQSA